MTAIFTAFHVVEVNNLLVLVRYIVMEANIILKRNGWHKGDTGIMIVPAKQQRNSCPYTSKQEMINPRGYSRSSLHIRME